MVIHLCNTEINSETAKTVLREFSQSSAILNPLFFHPFFLLTYYDAEGGIYMQIALSELNPGERGKVVKVESPVAVRLRELGLGVGTVVECVLRSPLSDPAAYRIKGALIAIRDKDCAGIGIKRM